MYILDEHDVKFHIAIIQPAAEWSANMLGVYIAMDRHQEGVLYSQLVHITESGITIGLGTKSNGLSTGLISLQTLERSNALHPS